MLTTTIMDTLTQTLTHLVRFPTVSNDNATNRACLDWIEQQLSDLPLDIKRLEKNGVPSLVATTSAVRDPKKPKLWVLGHIDVLTAPPELFEPKIEGTKLMGRGTFDMKYGVAVFITLLQQLGEDLPNYDLGLMLTSDEEVAGTNGAQWLVSEGYRAQAVINPECGTSWNFETGAKGVSSWRFTANGRAAHGSRPWQGHNAIDQVMEFVNLLKKNFVTEPCGDPNHAHNTINFSVVSGGNTVNQVPENATAEVDMRIMPDTTPDDITNLIERTRAIVPGIEAEQIYAMSSYQIPMDSAPVKHFLQIATDVLGHKPDETFSHGSSDARFFADYNVPTLHLPPLGGGQHAIDEWVDLEALTQFYEIVLGFVDDWTKV